MIVTEYPSFPKTRVNPEAEFQEKFAEFKAHVNHPNFTRMMYLRDKPKNLRPLQHYQSMYNGIWAIIKALPTDYDNINTLSAYFTDDIRAKGRESGNQSVNDWWLENHQTVLAKIKTPDFDNLPLHQQYHLAREQIYNDYGKKHECTSFRPVVAATLCKLFDVKTMFDPCIGWTDRLIGCAAAGVKYYGCDPHTELIPRVHQCVEATKADANIFHMCAEDFTSLKTQVDMAFTSPPFNRREIYTDEETQSVRKYPTYNSWIKYFLHATLNNCCTHVRNGGIIAINIVDYEKVKLVKPTIDHLTRRGHTYTGVIWYQGGRGFMPILIFRVNKK